MGKTAGASEAPLSTPWLSIFEVAESLATRRDGGSQGSGGKRLMKVWFHKVHESRRQMVETSAAEVRIGRDPSNVIVLSSPLVSKRHAVVRQVDGKLEL